MSELFPAQGEGIQSLIYHYSPRSPHEFASDPGFHHCGGAHTCQVTALLNGHLTDMS